MSRCIKLSCVFAGFCIRKNYLRLRKVFNYSWTAHIVLQGCWQLLLCLFILYVMPITPLATHILYVVPLWANLQMLGIEAYGIVTAMQNHIVLYGGVTFDTVQHCWQSMHTPSFTTVPAGAITIVRTLGPFPTTVANCFVLCKWFGCVTLYGTWHTVTYGGIGIYKNQTLFKGHNHFHASWFLKYIGKSYNI